MSIFDELRRGGAIVLELPIHRELEVVLKMAKIDVNGFQLPDNPVGKLSPDGLALLSKFPHLDPSKFILAQACGRRDMLSNLSRIKGGLLIGVDTFFIIYGDVERGSGVAPTELISEVKRRFPEAHVGAAISPGRQDEDQLIRKKLEAGADFFTTQICFDAELLLNLLRKVKLGKPLMLALAINFDVKSLTKMEKLGLHIPPSIRERLVRDPELESLNVACEIYKEVSENYDGPLSAYFVPFGEVEKVEKMINMFKSNLPTRIGG